MDLAKEVTLKSVSGKVWRVTRVDDTQGKAFLVVPGKVFALKTEGEKQYLQSITFEGPFPENETFTVTLPKEFKDDAGRELSNKDKFPLLVKTHGYPPLAKFSSHFGIVEYSDVPLLPVTVRNIETEIRAWMGRLEGRDQKNVREDAQEIEKMAGIVQNVDGQINKVAVDNEEAIIEWLKRLRRTDRRKSIFREAGQGQRITIPKPGLAKEFEVIGIPLKDTGFYVVELESRLLGAGLLSKPAPMYVPASALVTNMAAHFKWGRESSLVWVTSLDTAKPVSNAAVTLRDCSGKVIWLGKTNTEGLAKITGRLPSEESLAKCPLERRNNDNDENYWLNTEESPLLGGIASGLFVFVRKDNDMTFTHSSWDNGIDPWRFNLPVASGSTDQGNLFAHTILDRTLFRAGETVSMKHLIRQRDMMKGFIMPPRSVLPSEIVIRHVGSDQKYVFPLKWHENGSAETVWSIPQNEKLGTYLVNLEQNSEEKEPQGGKGKKKKYRKNVWTTGSFQVEEFRVPLMTASVKGPKEVLIKTKEVSVDISLSYLAGGGASYAPVKLRSEIRPKFIAFPDYEEFTFANGYVKKGFEKPRYDEEETEYEDSVPVTERAGRSGEERDIKLKTQEMTLDKTGSARTSLSGIPEIDAPRDLVTELEFRDPNGETQTVSSKIGLYPAKIHAGIVIDRAGRSGDPLKYKVIAVDLTGKPVSGTEVRVTLLQRKTYSHRRRITGGFYAYESTTEVVEVGPHCQGKTDKEGILFCEAKSPVAGAVILQAEVKDEAGDTSAAYSENYIYGESDQWFEAENDDRFDLIPEKKSYEPGDKARFQIRMPFREATVLVSVEREGVLESYVKKVSRKNPVIEIPVQNHYSPNVYVSALVVRGRVGDTKPTATFDPGKPVYKLGIAQINVGWRAHELKVHVATDKKTYRVRETVEAKISVRTALNKIPPEGSEVTVAVVDEGLLELKNNESWKLLEAMMKKRPYEVHTSTAQMMVVGKRHFGKKAFPHGGGGGKQVTRKLFGTLLFWKASVLLDKNGEAMVKIPLNDSLTSFRIVAVAAGGASLFGTGMATVATTQELMVFSGMPPLVREGDRFTANFTVRNTSMKTMNVEAKLSVTDKAEKKELKPVTERVPAGESREIKWEMTAPFGQEKLIYEMRVVETNDGGSFTDTIKVSQKVVPATPVRTFQATLAQLTAPFRLDVKRPVDALPERGGIKVIVKPKIAEGLSGVTEYMKDYPYTCFEQKISKAVALRDEEAWKTLMEELPSYLDRDGLIRYFPLSFILGSDVLTSYVLSIAHEAGYGIPQPMQAKMTDGLTKFIEGRIVRWSSLPTADLAMRKIAAIEALSRYGQARGGLLESITIEPNLWPTSALLDWTNLLARAGKDIPDSPARLKEAQTILRSRLNFQGTTMNFSTEKSDYCWWLMVSPDTNAVRTLLTVLQFSNWNQDTPRIAQGVVGRLKKGHWNTTVGNAWGVLAMEKFSRKFESIPVTGTTGSSLGTKTTVNIDWGQKPKGGEAFFNWPAKKEALYITHKGTGKPWATIQSLAAIPLKGPFSSGYKIVKTISPIEQKIAGKWSKGDVARVHLEINAQSDMTWVVVNDPVPAGSTILGSGLGRDSAMLTKKESEKGWAREVFRERSFEAMRVYYEYIWKGNMTVEYTVRFNNEGTFNLPETRVEALYSPEMFGEIPNKKMEILP